MRAAPAVVDNLLAQVKADLPRFLDVQYLAVTVLVKNKAQLNELMQGMAGEATKFIRRSGIYFGFAIGLVQTVAWAYFHNPWIMPAFGFSYRIRERLARPQSHTLCPVTNERFWA